MRPRPPARAECTGWATLIGIIGEHGKGVVARVPQVAGLRNGQRAWHRLHRPRREHRTAAATRPTTTLPAIVSAAALLGRGAGATPAVIIDGLLRRREVANLIAAPKSHKSFLALLIALCVATGRMLFGTFPVVRGRVLILDYELHRGTIFERMRAVATAAGIMADEYADTLDVITLRESHLDMHGLVKFTHRELLGRDYRLVIVDSFYNTLPADADENSNAQIARYYTTFKQLAGLTDAAWLLIHHMSQGLPGGEASQRPWRRGRQPIPVRRRAPGPAPARDARRDGPRRDPAELGADASRWGCAWQYPLWRHDATLDVTALAKPSTGRPSKAKDSAARRSRPDRLHARDVRRGVHLRRAQEPAPDRRGGAGRNVPFRDIQGLILRAAYAKVIATVWKFPATGPMYYANREQTLLDVSCLTHTHAPPHPPVGQQVPTGAAGTKKRTPQGGDVVTLLPGERPDRSRFILTVQASDDEIPEAVRLRRFVKWLGRHAADRAAHRRPPRADLRRLARRRREGEMMRKCSRDNQIGGGSGSLLGTGVQRVVDASTWQGRCAAD